MRVDPFIMGSGGLLPRKRRGFSLPLRSSLVGSDGRVASFTRASDAWYEDADGTIKKALSGAPRFRADRGVLIEEARTNRLKFSRDLSNAVWTKVNSSITKNQTGADGVANAAYSVTASAAGAVLYQWPTGLASAVRTSSLYVKRLSGTGPVKIYNQAGSPIVTPLALTSSWQRFTVTGTADTGFCCGIVVETQGDSVAVDFAQVEDGTFATSPIETAGSALARAADVLSVSTAGWPVAGGVARFRYVPAALAGDRVLFSNRTPIGSPFNGLLLYVTSANAVLFTSGNGATTGGAVSGVLSWVAEQGYRFEAEWGGGKIRVWRDGALIASDMTGALPMPTALRSSAGIANENGASHLNGWLADLEVA